MPELLAEPGFRRNLLGHETYAMLFAERNWPAMQQVLGNIRTEYRDELALRMTNESTHEVLRLLYAAMLANTNDDRGRAYLRKAADVQGDKLDLNALYCLGAFPFFAVDEDRGVDIAWTEQLLIDLISNMNTVAVRGTFPGRQRQRATHARGECRSKRILQFLRCSGRLALTGAANRLMSFVATRGCRE